MNKRKYISTQREEVIPEEFEVVFHEFVNLTAKRRLHNDKL